MIEPKRDITSLAVLGILPFTYGTNGNTLSPNCLKRGFYQYLEALEGSEQLIVISDIAVQYWDLNRD